MVRVALSDLYRTDGTIDRGPYALVGLLAFALKHNLDRALAAMFGRPWGIFNYWIPLGRFTEIGTLTNAERTFLGVMVLASLPFIYVGVVLTLRRLRSAGLPLWMVGFFFVPFVNLVFLLTLCLVPPKVGPDGVRGASQSGRAGAFLGRIIPQSAAGSAAMAVLLTLPAGGSAILVCAALFRSYAWTLFLAIPFGVGVLSVLIYSYHEPRSLGSCVLVAIGACALLAAAMLSIAFEGIICILMAAPIAGFLAICGGIAGFLIQLHWPVRRQGPALLAAIVLGLPSMGIIEGTAAVTSTEFAVRSTIEIDAPPEAVWEQVIAFSTIPEPREWLFRAGIAYPKRAEIHGRGAGAVRHCVFSTGDFVEPIEIWDPPRLLKFSVSACPAPMEEWTPYGPVGTPHLRGFLVSRHGQFLLTRLPGGRTRLEGTTWYVHGLWPETYWRVWSDAIIHRIHRRVLDHIRKGAEASLAGSGA